MNDKQRLIAAIDEVVESERKRLQIAVGTDQMKPETARAKLAAVKKKAAADKAALDRYVF